MKTQESNLLSRFFEASVKDNRMGKAHLALYLALFCRWRSSGFPNPLPVFSKEMMPGAKISSSATYHYLIRDLHDYGYIRYVPSFYKHTPSQIFLEV